MLDKNSLIVLAYLKNHFTSSDNPVCIADILSTGLSTDDIIKAIDILEDNGHININHKYQSNPIESINI